ncbi:MAG: ABC transporter ATP-binding protein [Ignavibacteria bacterium]|nr:MAG: ABC transporter ATP-binding protein [Ignavibacteria bacterium]
MQHAVEVDHVSHSYERTKGFGRLLRRLPDRERTLSPALKNVSFSVREGEMFCLLGPNGSGKSTLFKILSTLMRQTSGSVRILDRDISTRLVETRRDIGVVFQHPSLDGKLSASENLLCQGSLYNLRGAALRTKIDGLLARVGLSDRAGDLVEKLSGGMQRRVELAKAFLHDPRLLILDEASTGLDPGARKDFDRYLKQLCAAGRTTALLTTHILDEAELCDRIAILDRGTLVALGSPFELKREIGGDIVSIATGDPENVSRLIKEKFGGDPQLIDGMIRIERTDGHEFIPQLVRALPGVIDAVTLSKPTLEDVFIRKTGHTFREKEGNN